MAAHFDPPPLRDDVLGELAAHRGAHPVQHDDQRQPPLGNGPGDAFKDVLHQQQLVCAGRGLRPGGEFLGEPPVQPGPSLDHRLAELGVGGGQLRHTPVSAAGHDGERAVGPGPVPQHQHGAVGQRPGRRLRDGEPAGEADGGLGGGAFGLVRLGPDMARGQVERVLGTSQVDRPRVGQQAGEHVGQAGQPGLETRVQDLAGRGEITGAQFGQDLLGPDAQLPATTACGPSLHRPISDSAASENSRRSLPPGECPPKKRSSARTRAVSWARRRRAPGSARPRSASPSGTASPTSACSSKANTAQATGPTRLPQPVGQPGAFFRGEPTERGNPELVPGPFQQGRRVHDRVVPAVADPEPDAHQPVHREVEREHRPAHLAPAAGRLGL